MPALDNKVQISEKKRRKRFHIILITLWFVLAPLTVELLDGVFRGIFQSYGVFEFNFDYIENLRLLMQERNRQVLFGVFTTFAICGLFMLLYRVRPEISAGETMEVAQGIHIPVPAGNGEYGTSRFMTAKEMDDKFATATYTGKGKVKGLSHNAGIIVDYMKHGSKEIIHYLNEAVNVIILGATRCGKTRRLLMTSTWLDILAGVNLLVVDVKGEIFAFTNKFAKLMGYEIRTLDYRYFNKSMHFNNLCEINELLRKKKISEAVNKAWDIVSVLVGEPKGERIWTDGQCATIAAAILIVAQDAPEWAKNLTNVYYFLAYMCEPDPETGDMPITDYLNELPNNHPARGAFQIAKIAPFRTRSSFFTSALATLRLYTDWNVADITQMSDYEFSDTDEKKVITYLILPDEKTTYHPLGAIYIKQYYESLVEQAIKKGGKLDRRFIFRADEIGNFPVIPALGTMLSAGAGRNIFFELVLQDYQQLEGKYKDDFRNLKTNCLLTICLKVIDEQSTKAINTQLGTYTIQVNSASSSVSDGRSEQSNYSCNANLGGRPLLFPDEISSLQKPDALILYDGKKAITHLPDLSEYYANKEFGMGDEEFNKKLFLKRMDERPSREITAPRLWGVWEDYGATFRTVDIETEDSEEKVSFLA